MIRDVCNIEYGMENIELLKSWKEYHSESKYIIYSPSKRKIIKLLNDFDDVEKWVSHIVPEECIIKDFQMFKTILREKHTTLEDRTYEKIYMNLEEINEEFKEKKIIWSFDENSIISKTSLYKIRFFETQFGGFEILNFNNEQIEKIYLGVMR